MQDITSTGRRRRFVQLGITATTFVLASVGLVAVTGTPAFAVPPGCGPYSGSAPPPGYNMWNMEKEGDTYYDSVGGPDFVVGNVDEADTIILTGTNDIVCARGGADVIFAGGGADIIYAGDGADEVYGELGNDEIHGGKDGDLLVGDRFTGPGDGDGNDEIHGGEDTDDIYGYDGDDVIFGGLGANDLGDGGDGVDTCDAGVEDPVDCS